MTRPALSDIDVVRSALGEDYEILDELGRGGMAVVYRARERVLERDVAVKVLPFALTFDDDFVERFQREARTAAQLEHPHIVPIYRVGRSGQVIYFVMRLLRGRSLSDVIGERGRLPVAEIRRILVETGSALGYAARRGVVHRDVKPDNILLDESGRCVVTDFGIAKSGADRTLTATGMSVGTPRYMSPEQARARTTDGRSDIYSLGVVAYECLVGHVPFDADDAVAILLDHVQSPLPRPALESAEEWELFEIVERMLAKRPEDRFESADALLAALGPGQGAQANGDLAGPRRRSTPARTLPPAYAPPERAGGEGSDPHTPQVLDRALERALERARAEGTRGARWVRARSPRFWRAVAGVGVLLAAAWWGGHFAFMHRSRCPEPSVRRDVPRDGTDEAALPFTLLVDGIRRHGGGEVELYYDVCGLPERTPFTTDVVVVRHTSTLKRLFGGAPAVREGFHEVSDGPRTRRHRGIDAGDLEPGRYGVTVTVVDDRKRRREKSVDFEVR